jgi:hypothetical protein
MAVSVGQLHLDSLGVRAAQGKGIAPHLDLHRIAQRSIADDATLGSFGQPQLHQPEPKPFGKPVSRDPHSLTHGLIGQSVDGVVRGHSLWG